MMLPTFKDRPLQLLSPLFRQQLQLTRSTTVEPAGVEVSAVEDAVDSVQQDDSASTVFYAETSEDDGTTIYNDNLSYVDSLSESERETE